MEQNNDYPGKQWHPIFDYMVDNFDVSLTLSEMEALINGVLKVVGHTTLQARCTRYEKALKEIGASNCDYQTLDDSKLHSTECRACKANEALSGEGEGNNG